MEAWARISAKDEFGLNDQETLTFAIGEVDDIQLMGIGATAHGTIKHSCASLAHGTTKVNGHQRFMNKVKEALYPLYWAFNKDRWLEQESLEQSLRAESSQM
jgi:hypothetical protein